MEQMEQYKIAFKRKMEERLKLLTEEVKREGWIDRLFTDCQDDKFKILGDSNCELSAFGSNELKEPNEPLDPYKHLNHGEYKRPRKEQIQEQRQEQDTRIPFEKLADIPVFTISSDKCEDIEKQELSRSEYYDLRSTVDSKQEFKLRPRSTKVSVKSTVTTRKAVRPISVFNTEFNQTIIDLFREGRKNSYNTFIYQRAAEIALVCWKNAIVQIKSFDFDIFRNHSVKSIRLRDPVTDERMSEFETIDKIVLDIKSELETICKFKVSLNRTCYGVIRITMM